MKHTFLKWAKEQKGFTLVELIIVIAVIGVLATITYSGSAAVFKKGKEDEVRSALTGSRQKIDDYKKKEGVYPQYNQLPSGTVPTSYTGNYYYWSSYGWCGDGQCYCLEITDSVGYWPLQQQFNYHISSINTDPLPGGCNGFQQEALGNGLNGQTITGNSTYGTLEIEGKTPLKGTFRLSTSTTPVGYVSTALVRVAVYLDGVYSSSQQLTQYGNYVNYGGGTATWYLGSVNYGTSTATVKVEWQDPNSDWSELISITLP